MRVGLCLTGSKAHRNDGIRSIPKGMAHPLAAVPGIEWVWMSADGWTDDLAALGITPGVTPDFDWQDTADLAVTLDLVITVDTALAHLCGGLGVPTWLLLSAVPDMRWMIGTPDHPDRDTGTPWYDSMTLYRQPVAGDWATVLDRVAADLRAITTPMQEAA